MVTNQRMGNNARKPNEEISEKPNDYGITEEGIRSEMAGDSVPGADGQNAVPLITLELKISYRIIQNTVPDTPMTLISKSNKGGFAVSGRNSS
jgi:hypothetical protein